MIEPTLVLPFKCKRPQIGADGRCVRCGRRAKYDPAYGREVHVRGRVAGVSPYRREDGPRRTYVPATPRRRCPDCHAVLQAVGGLLRCPWTSTTRSRRADDVVACDWPYDRDRAERIA